MKILMIIAGTNNPSNSETLAWAFRDGIEAAFPTVEINMIRLDHLNIGHFNLSHYDPATPQEEDFQKIEKMIKEANGVVIASPIWNFGVPAHLKNLIDRMGRFALDDTKSVGTLGGKPFYIIHTGGIPEAGWYGMQKRTVSHLPTSIQYFGGTVIDTHYEGRCTPGRGQFGEVVSKRPESIEKVKEKGKKFGEVVDIFTNEGTLPMVQTGWKYFWAIGGRVKKAIGL